MSAVVLTACTNRKRCRPTLDLTAAALPMGSLEAVVRAWLSRVSAEPKLVAATRLYCGRSFIEARLAALQSGAPLFVVSAGLGLIDAEEQIPSYSLTVSNGAVDNVLSRITAKHGTPRDWWRSISSGSPFSESLEDLAARHTEGPILLALAAPYLLMLEDDLLRLPEASRDRLRIFVRGGEAIVDERLRRWVMPYDSRFDGEDSPLRGTHGDFAQRAMRHFAETILGEVNGATPETHRASVARALAPLKPPRRIRRAPATDDQVKELIRAHWTAVDGRSGRMLRVLRDEAEIACEQGRFAGLFRAVQAEREPTT